MVQVRHYHLWENATKLDATTTDEGARPTSTPLYVLVFGDIRVTWDLQAVSWLSRPALSHETLHFLHRGSR
jgi:hypothetical protein